ncbi:MAG TPA: DUF6395 domain-containing protein [Fulvivirga sp.]|nr:DUF6395 domain-containing protein [Fulvivirga sp.]
MIFKTNIEDNKFIIRAITENIQEASGFMLEGSFRPIKLVSDEVRLEFNYIPERTHPDILALICYCAFYPYLTKSDGVTFPEPISVKAKSEFEKFFTFYAKNGQRMDADPIAVRNYSESQKPYKGEYSALIAFGGGMDSTSLSLLFPEYLVVNQVDIPDHRGVMHDYFKILSNRNPEFSGISEYTNIRGISEPYGFSGWVCCFLLPLLVATDKNMNSILSGAIFGSSYMSGSGKKFNTDSLKYNKPFKEVDKKWKHRSWLYLFKELGIFQYSPVAGLTEVLSSKLIYDNKLATEVLYCQQNEGKPCHQCPKCFRKNLELEFWEYVHTGEIRTLDYWNGYNNKRTINRYRDDYQYFGHIMNFLSQSVPNYNKPNWFKDNALFCNANTSWVTKCYTKSLGRIPDEFLKVTKERLESNFEYMDQVEIFLTESYNHERYAFSNFAKSKEALSG